MQVFLRLALILACSKVYRADVVVTENDIFVECGSETPDSYFGPIKVTVTVPSYPDALQGANYKVFMFDSPSNCAFTPNATGLDQGSDIFGNTYNTIYDWEQAAFQLSAGQKEQCGWTRVTEQRVEGLVAVVEGTIFTNSDKVFPVACEYPAAIIPDRDYTVELLYEGRVASGPVPIGAQVQLRVRGDGPDDGDKGGVVGDENGLQVYACEASNSEGANTAHIISEYCIDLSGGVDFVEMTDPAGFYSTDLLADSPMFEMFDILGGNVPHVVVFRCQLVICRTSSCNGDNCPSKRRKRSLLDTLSNGRHRDRRSTTPGYVIVTTAVEAGPPL